MYIAFNMLKCVEIVFIVDCIMGCTFVVDCNKSCN